MLFYLLSPFSCCFRLSVSSLHSTKTAISSFFSSSIWYLLFTKYFLSALFSFFSLVLSSFLISSLIYKNHTTSPTLTFSICFLSLAFSSSISSFAFYIPIKSVSASFNFLLFACRIFDYSTFTSWILFLSSSFCLMKLLTDSCLMVSNSYFSFPNLSLNVVTSLIYSSISMNLIFWVSYCFWISLILFLRYSASVWDMARSSSCLD